MGSRRPPEHRWVLDYHQPGARTEPTTRLELAGEDDEDPPEAAPLPAGAMVEQVRGLYGPGPDSAHPLALEAARFLGEDLLSVELVLPGERRGPLGGAMAVVRVQADGRGLVTVPEAGAEVRVVDSREAEEVVVPPPVEDLEVPPGGRVLVRHGEGLLLVRAVAAAAPPRPRLGPARALALVALAALLSALALWALLRWR